MASVRDEMSRLTCIRSIIERVDDLKAALLESILGMMPKLGPLKDLKDAKVDDKEITRVVAIIDSMTNRERANHMIINGSGHEFLRTDMVSGDSIAK